MTDPGGSPLVSVLIAVYNGVRHLGEAIDSVLGQTYPAVELIVVDDGSDDGSGEVARRYVPSLRHAYQPHAGIGAARNHSVSLATGAFLAFLDADDRFPAQRLERQIEAFRRNPGLDMVLGHVHEFLSPELDEAARRQLRLPIERAPGYTPVSMLVRRDSFLKVGPFATGLKVGIAMDWWVRAVDLQLGTVMLEEIVLERRLHSANNGIRERDSRGQYLHVLKAALDRRRRIV
jgi:glycosyltransferase involved in cell wall biosynthesis